MTNLINTIRVESESGHYEYNIQVDHYPHRNDFTTNIFFDSFLLASHIESDRQMYYQKQRDLNNAIALNTRLANDIRRLQTGITECQSYLSDLRKENERVRTFEAHKLLLDHPHLTLSALTQLRPLTEPIARFKQNNKYRGCPHKNGYSLPALALLNNDQKVFIMAINEKGYALNDPAIANEHNPLEQLRKHPNAISLLTSIQSKITQDCVDSLAIKAVNDLESINPNPADIQPQLNIMIWLLKSKNVSYSLQQRLQRLAVEYAPTHFAFSEAFFSSRMGNFYALDAEQRLLFLRALITAQRAPNEILRWYITDNTCKINELYSDFESCGFVPSTDMMSCVIQENRAFNPEPNNAILNTWMDQYQKGEFPALKTFTKQQPAIIKHWFLNALTTHNTKMELICLRPDLFTTKQCDDTFANEPIAENVVLTACYKEFLTKLESVDTKTSAPVLFAFAKTRIEQATSAEQIRLFALDLEREWKTKEVPIRFTEVMMKVAKNSALKLLREDPTQASDALSEFMGKHRVRHYLFYCIPLPHLFAPSKNIYKQYKSKNRLAGDAAFEKEEQREKDDVDSIISPKIK